MRHIIHDLNNHIAALLSFSDLVLDELPADDKRRDRFEAIRTIGQRAVVRSHADMVPQVAVAVAELRVLASSALDEVADPSSTLYADAAEIAMAADHAFMLLMDVAVRDAA